MSGFFSGKRIALGIVLAVLIAAVAVGFANREYIEQIPIGCAVKAKGLCAGLFLQGIDQATLEREDFGFNSLFKIFKARVDEKNESVTVSLLGLGIFRKTAVIVDGLGPILLSGTPERTVRSMKPAMPAAAPADPATVDWPTGDRMPVNPPRGIDLEALKKVLDTVFSEPSADPKLMKRTRAVVVAYDGRIAAERYAPGIDKDTRLLSWSMAKSFTNALVGILVKQGKLDVRSPAAVPEWQGANDPRKAITVDQLLRMSSGLTWFEDYTDHPVSDVNRMLFLTADHAAFAAAKPLASAPDSAWNYSSGTTNIVSRLIRDTVGDREAYWEFPRKELFDKIGMKSAVWGTDAVGNFVGSSYLYATARDFARFGLLCLNDGVWNGERILPEGWMAYSTTPTPKADKGQYGAFFWLNRGSAGNPSDRVFPSLPPDLYWADGYQGQRIYVCPSLKLVAVRLGMTWDADWGEADFISGIAGCIAK